LVHLTGQANNGFRVVDIWESEEAVRRFRETISPITQQVGIDEPPEFFPAHTPLFRVELRSRVVIARQLRQGTSSLRFRDPGRPHWVATKGGWRCRR
jgi:hypothetical protein